MNIHSFTALHLSTFFPHDDPTFLHNSKSPRSSLSDIQLIKQASQDPQSIHSTQCPPLQHIHIYLQLLVKQIAVRRSTVRLEQTVSRRDCRLKACYFIL